MSGQVPVGALSLFRGPSEPKLVNSTIGDLLKRQALQFPHNVAVLALGSQGQLTFSQLHEKTKLLARVLLASGISNRDRIGIFAGNVAEYVEVFLAATRIGAVAVLLNTFYSTEEIKNALSFTGCSMLFITRTLGRRDLSSCIAELQRITALDERSELPMLKRIILLCTGSSESSSLNTYEAYINKVNPVTEELFEDMQTRVSSDSACNFQFTSGTTGTPKTVMLSHFNIVNNGRFVGDRIRLHHTDVICCPVPLFHAAGLVLGLMGCLVYGCTLVLPSPVFDPIATVNALESAKCSGIHGVPTIFTAVLESYRQLGITPSGLRTGTIGGSQVSPSTLKDLQCAFGFKDLGVGYGMTETSPLSYLATGPQPDDTVTWLEIMPHTQAKIVDSQGNTVPVGCSGELCIAGYLLQKGYYRNPEKTEEVMRIYSEDNLLWMHTGDEAIMNEKGQCRISGRIKDIIIRGGENIYPAEIEDRLNMHVSIAMSAVVGVADAKYGEVVAAFLQLAHGQKRPLEEEIQAWVRKTLGKHKVPQWVFYVGTDGALSDFPKTASGKIKKVDLVTLGNRLVQRTSKM